MMKKKISPNEFDSYTKGLRDYLYKQMEVVDVCGMKYPMPSWEAVRAIERGFESFPLIILTDIEQLQIKEDLHSDVKDLESQMSSFKKSPDGPSFQQLFHLILKLDKLMDDLGKKYKSNYTSPGYSLNSADY